MKPYSGCACFSLFISGYLNDTVVVLASIFLPCCADHVWWQATRIQSTKWWIVSILTALLRQRRIGERVQNGKKTTQRLPNLKWTVLAPDRQAAINLFSGSRRFSFLTCWRCQLHEEINSLNMDICHFVMWTHEVCNLTRSIQTTVEPLLTDTSILRTLSSPDLRESRIDMISTSVIRTPPWEGHSVLALCCPY